MVSSLDGKISSGDSDSLDIDTDWKRIHGVKDGLFQYYDLEKQTDTCFLQSGRVFAKLGFNERALSPIKIPVTGVIIDNKPHLSEKGILYLSSWLDRVIIVTTNPAYPLPKEQKNVQVIFYKDTLNFSHLFTQLKESFGIDHLTIQSGGTLNSSFLREGLIDHISLVIAPLLVGGATTPTLIDGEAIHSINELQNIKALELISCTLLKHSYLHLRYNVIKETFIDPL